MPHGSVFPRRYAEYGGSAVLIIACFLPFFLEPVPSGSSSNGLFSANWSLTKTRSMGGIVSAAQGDLAQGVRSMVKLPPVNLSGPKSVNKLVDGNTSRGILSVW